MADKELEAWYLERFIPTCPDFPVGIISPSEEPDFLIAAAQGTCGIEMTRYYVPLTQGRGPHQEQESLRDRILQEAAELFSREDPRLVHVNVLFSLGSRLGKNDIQPLARGLTAAVVRLEVELGEFKAIDEDSPLDAGLPDGIASIMVATSSKLTRSSWHCDDVALTPEAGPQHVQSILDAKEPRVDAYRRSASSIWLVVVVDATRLSSVADFPSHTFEHSYSTSFDRVYLFFTGSSRSTRLSIAGD